jgi:hypothetical protein
MRKGLLAVAVVLAVPASAHAGCITTLPIAAKLPSSDPRDYRESSTTLTVASRGPELRRVKVGIYSFRGRVMGERYVSHISDERPLRVHLKRRLHTGQYTLYAEGEPNRRRSCGPKHYARVVTIGTPSKGPKPPSGGGDEGDTGDSGDSGDAGENPDDTIPPDQQL